MKLNSRLKLNRTPFSFGLSYLFGAKKIFFDSTNLYLIKRRNETIYRLDRITDLERTPNIVNNRNIWIIRVRDGKGVVDIKFVPYYNGWKHNFHDFKDLLKKINPKVRISRVKMF